MLAVLNFLEANGFKLNDNLLDIQLVIVNNKILDVAILFKENSHFVVDFIDFERVAFLEEKNLRGMRYEYSTQYVKDAMDYFKNDIIVYQMNLMREM